MGDNYKNQPEQPKATPLWTAEKQIMESVDIEKTVVVNNKPAKQSKSYGKNQKPKKPFNKLWLVIPLCLALVAGTVLCGYLAFFTSKGDDDTEESSAVTDSSADSSEVLESKGFNWMLENGVLTITGIGPMPNFTVESPAPWMTAGEITAVVISNGITSIGDFAFYECEDITSVTIPSTVITIGKGAFEDCNSLESITVPEGVTSIDDGAFAGSGLTSVTIPSTVTDMGSDLFNHCAELISIVYNGTKEQWDAIEKDDTWQGNAPIKTVHCNDTAFDPQNPDAVLEYDAEGTTDKGLTWTLLDGTLTISGEGEMDDFEANEEDFINMASGEAYGEVVKRNDSVQYLNAESGSMLITIRGVKRLGGGEYTPISDRIVAGTYLLAPLVCGGNVLVKNVNPQHLMPLLQLLQNNACNIKVKGDNIKISARSRPKNFGKVETLPYPHFPTDLQQQLTAVSCFAKGTTVIVENLFEGRFKHVGELAKMCADIQVKDRSIIINGAKELFGATVEAFDLRGSASLFLAGMGANGYTTITNAQIINRGYYNIVSKFKSLGANIKIC